MKINLPKHTIVGRSKSNIVNPNNLEYVGLKEIPLAYINTEENEIHPIAHVNEQYVNSSKRYVRPYDTFDNEDVYLFDENDKIKSVTMKRIGDTYYYEPQNQTEYTPLAFSVHLKIQKQETYFNDKSYNIKVATIETGDNDSTLAEKLISIFADKYMYDGYPSNIRINGGAKTVESYTSQDYRDADFVFIESIDGVHFGDGSTSDEEIDFNYIMENYTNVWLSVDNFEYRLKVDDSITTYYTLHMNDTTIYENTEYYIPFSHAEVWDQDIGFIEDERGDTYSYEYVNEAVMILSKPGKGFIIITPKWFMDNLTYVAPIVYEVLMKCYLQQYCISREAPMWITDEPIDYLSYHEDKFNRNHNRVTVDELMLDHDFDYNNYNLVDVVVNTDDVRFIGINEQHELMFVKVASTSDPLKGVNEQSFYTTKHTVINYVQEDVFLIETPLTINFNQVNSAIYVIVEPMMSSMNRIYTTDAQTFRITDFTTQYGLYVNKGSTNMTNTFFLLDRREKPDSSWIQVATIRFNVTFKTVASDTRLLGGGLPEDQVNDYDMLDIGHINGRPYRLGSTFIVRVPKKLSNYKSRIETELNKHIAAGEEYVLVFE